MRRVAICHQQTDPATGRKLCLVCGKPVGKGRSSYCGDECRLRNTPEMIRIAVSHRDGGICAGCGVQCKCFKLRRLRWENRSAWDAMPKWHADHIIPVAEGGGLCGVEGYRTLCVPCHKKESALLAARLAGKRREGDK